MFPKALKVAFITPLYKSSPKNEISNYRSVTLISSLTKVLKKCWNQEWKIFWKTIIHYLTNNLVLENDLLKSLLSTWHWFIMHWTPTTKKCTNYSYIYWFFNSFWYRFIQTITQEVCNVMLNLMKLSVKLKYLNWCSSRNAVGTFSTYTLITFLIQIQLQKSTALLMILL